MAAVCCVVGRVIGRPVVVKLTGALEMNQGILDPGVHAPAIRALRWALAQATSGRASALALVQILGDSIARLQTGTALVRGDMVQATDSLVVPGVTARATVTIAGVQATQPPPLLTRWAWDVTRAPLELGVLYECQGRDAMVHVAGPPWATVQVGRAVQDAAFCSPKPQGWRLLSVRPPSLPWAGLLLGVGYLLGR